MTRWCCIAVASAIGLECLGAPSLAAAAALAPADDDDDAYVRTVASEAAGHVKAGRYAQALAVLDRAERDRPHAVFIYVRATIEEQRGNCERAAKLYREFLGHDVPEADAHDALAGEARCREALGLPPIEASGQTPPGDPIADPASDEGDSSIDTSPPPWHTDPVGGVLAVVGAVGLGAGVALLVQSRVDRRAAEGATELQLYDDRSQRATRLNTAGIVTLSVGAALLAGGVLRYAIVARRARRPRVSLAPGWSPLGPAASATLRF